MSKIAKIIVSGMMALALIAGMLAPLLISAGDVYAINLPGGTSSGASGGTSSPRKPSGSGGTSSPRKPSGSGGTSSGTSGGTSSGTSGGTSSGTSGDPSGGASGGTSSGTSGGGTSVSKAEEGVSKINSGNNTDLMGIIKLILNTVFVVIGILAVVFIIVGGINYTMSQGDPGKVKKAKDTILYGIIGLIVSLAAFAIVQFVLDSLK